MKSTADESPNYNQILLKHRPENVSEAEFLTHLRAAQPVLKALANLIEAEIVRTEMVRESDYDCPSWSHKQAHMNGYAQCARKIKKLLPDPTEK